MFRILPPIPAPTLMKLELGEHSKLPLLAWGFMKKEGKEVRSRLPPGMPPKSGRPPPCYEEGWTGPLNMLK